MTTPYSYKNTIAKAAALDNGLRLSGLYRICENQKTISAKKLLAIVEKIHDGNKLDAIHLRALANKLQVAQPQWLPIETAPLDTPILVVGGTIETEFGYDGACDVALVMRRPWASHRYECLNTCRSEVEVVSPTHWMPLPECPTTTE